MDYKDIELKIVSGSFEPFKKIINDKELWVNITCEKKQEYDKHEQFWYIVYIFKCNLYDENEPDKLIPLMNGRGSLNVEYIYYYLDKLSNNFLLVDKYFYKKTENNDIIDIIENYSNYNEKMVKGNKIVFMLSSDKENPLRGILTKYLKKCEYICYKKRLFDKICNICIDCSTKEFIVVDKDDNVLLKKMFIDLTDFLKIWVKLEKESKEISEYMNIVI
jgi:hypothetical protein